MILKLLIIIYAIATGFYFGASTPIVNHLFNFYNFREIIRSTVGSVPLEILIWAIINTSMLYILSLFISQFEVTKADYFIMFGCTIFGGLVPLFTLMILAVILS